MVTFVHSVFGAVNRVGRTLEYLGLTKSEQFYQGFMGSITPEMRNSSKVHVVKTEFAKSRAIVAWNPSRKAESGSKPGLIYIHGGGWAVGAPEFSDRLILDFAERTDATIFAISYRLSWQKAFPAAFDDCLSAVRAVFDSAADFGVSAERIGLAGDSAGGQLVASVVQALRRSDIDARRSPKLQVLIYPITQVVNLRTESYLTRVSEPVLIPKQMAGFISLYLTGSRHATDWLANHGHVTADLQAAYQTATGGQTLQSRVVDQNIDDAIDADQAAKIRSVAADYRVSPLLGDGLDKLGLPSTHIIASEFDPLLDDALLYADRLQRSGVRIHLKRFATFHAAAHFPTDGQEIRDHIVRILASEL